jgi:hypothetical protein
VRVEIEIVLDDATDNDPNLGTHSAAVFVNDHYITTMRADPVAVLLDILGADRKDDWCDNRAHDLVEKVKAEKLIETQKEGPLSSRGRAFELPRRDLRAPRGSVD